MKNAKNAKNTTPLPYPTRKKGGGGLVGDTQKKPKSQSIAFILSPTGKLIKGRIFHYQKDAFKWAKKQYDFVDVETISQRGWIWWSVDGCGGVGWVEESRVGDDDLTNKIKEFNKWVKKIISHNKKNKNKRPPKGQNGVFEG